MLALRIFTGSLIIRVDLYNNPPGFSDVPDFLNRA
jgi:hypothetical protein